MPAHTSTAGQTLEEKFQELRKEGLDLIARFDRKRNESWNPIRYAHYSFMILSVRRSLKKMERVRRRQMKESMDLVRRNFLNR